MSYYDWGERLNIHQLQLFCAVAQAGGFTRAAQELHITQQAVSLQVKRFEDSLGFPLFVQSGRSIHLTPAGKEVFQRGSELLESVREFSQWTESIRTGGTDKIHVVCSSTPGGFLLPMALQVFRERYPNIEVVMRVVMTDDLPKVMTEVPSLDFALYIEQSNVPGLAATPIAEDELWLVAGPGSRLALQNGPVSLVDLVPYPIVLRYAEDGIAQALIKAMAAHSLSPRVMYVGSMEGCRTAVMSGYGITYLSRLAAEESVRTGLLRRILVPELQHRRTVYLATRPGHELTAPAQYLLELLCQRFPASTLLTKS